MRWKKKERSVTMNKQKIFSFSQMLMILVLTFLGLKNGFDVFIYASIILLLSSIGLNALCMKSNS